MATGISLEIKKNDFARLSGKLPRETSAIISKAAFDVITLATPKTPVDTGFLRNSATVAMENDFLAIVTWAAEYAAYQEFGTRSIAPRLFATGGAEQVRPEFTQAMKQMLKGLEA